MGREKSDWEGAVDGERRKDVNGSVDAVSHNMPGILPRSESAPKISHASKMANDMHNDSSASEIPRETKKADYCNGDKLTNGDYGHLNGIATKGRSPSPTTIQRETCDRVKNDVGQLPPEIEHITFGYQPFSLLVSRLVQETFNGLTDVIGDMSEMPVPQQAQNGPLNHVNQQMNGNAHVSGGNIQKKLRMMNFASDRRAQFIKLLILLRWSSQAEAVSKAIDLNVWTSNRLREYNDCISWMGELKRILVPLRDPNPDIKTALEVLSLNKASWLPDLGYLPPEHLTPQQLLGTLQRINTLLAIRLNLHETIPPALKNFSIASGRATFRVLDEFEVDLSIAEEDPSSQLYFIDFRFIFFPTPPQLPAGRLRDEVESRANDLLKSDGLQGLFDFLHNLAITHKLSILRNQAYELARGYWSEQLKVEPVHRSFVVQYWLNRPGGKNWIEIGLKRGKGARSSYSLNTQRRPHISLRWFRGGKEVTNFEVAMNMQLLSLAAILKQVIALHTSYIFEEMVAKLKESVLYSGQYLRIIAKPSEKEPLDAYLHLQLTSKKAIKVIQEPVSGRFSVLPASQLNSRTEHELNRLSSPATEGASPLSQLRSFASHEEVETSARQVGWTPVLSLNPHPEVISKIFGRGIQRVKFFRRSAWDARWILAFTTSLEGDFWWMIELTESETANGPTKSTSSAGQTLREAYKILPRDKPMLECSHSTLTSIEQTAAGMIAQYVDSRAMALAKIPHRFQLPRDITRGSQLGCILARLAVASASRSPKVASVSWLNDMVRLDFRGLDASRCFAIYTCRVHLQRSVSKFQRLISAIAGIAFQPAVEGVLESVTFQCRAKVGETVVHSLESRLRGIGLLLDFASTIVSYNLKSNTASLTELDFNYTRSANPLRAIVRFSDGINHTVSLAKFNPHLRIVDHLTNRLRSQGLTAVIGVLRMTLCLMRGLFTIESAQNNTGVEVLTRSDQWYQVRYSEPYSKGSFDIRLRQRRDDPLWFVPESTIKRAEDGNQGLKDRLEALTRERGEGWWGVKGGLIAHINGVEKLVAKLDEVFRTSKYVAGDSNPNKRKAEADVVEID